MTLRSIKFKIIFAMILTGLICSLVVGSYNIYRTVEDNKNTVNQYRIELIDSFDRNVRFEVETAISILQDVYNQQQQGLLSETDAKKRAADIIRNLRFDNGNYFWIDTTDGVNVVLLGRDQEGKNRLSSKDAKGTEFIKDLIGNGMQPGGGYTNYWFSKPNQTEPLPKRSYTLLFQPYNWIVGTGNWIDEIDVLVAKKEQEQAALLRGQITIGLLCCLVGIILSTLLAFLLGNALAKPMLRIRNRIVTMAEGDYSADISADITNRRDEFGEIATALDILNKNMREIIRHIIQSAEQVVASSEELTASAEQTAKAANQVAVVITEVATGATDQLNAVNNTTSVVTQMSAGVKEIAANAEIVNDASTESAQAAEAGRTALEEATAKMTHIEKTVTQSAQLVTKLGERSNEIGQIVDTISNIASQTNLLALNAAIEAARAGEQGRGFAVVAEEVRKLAEQSQDAAKLIASLIADIQADTTNAVSAMNEGTNVVQVGTEVVNNAAQIFNQIFLSITNVSSQLKSISIAIKEVADGNQNVVTSIKEIDAISKATAGQTQTVSAAAEEQFFI
ncbi:MAG: methyl-accepting chemotaxis protein [Firmicutes bacterium]|nr:methyl-accepting chemotaxis protein [Bacillota bacterium]